MIVISYKASFISYCKLDLSLYFMPSDFITAMMHNYVSDIYV